MAVFQVLAHFTAYVARGLQLTRNPGRVIGFHLLSRVSNSRWVPEFGDGCLPTRFCLDQGL